MLCIAIPAAKAEDYAGSQAIGIDSTPVWQVQSNQSHQPSVLSYPARQPRILLPASTAKRNRKVLPREGPSLFEQYVSGTIDITDTQLGIIRRLGRVEFRYGKDGLSVNQAAIAVRIVKERRSGRGGAGRPEIIDAGYLVGAPEDIESTLGFLGIENPFGASTNIKQFGYDIFNQAPSSFAPDNIVPVGPDYLLGPGDELRITVWGKVNAEFDQVIDRDGGISIPPMGIMHLSGLTFKEARDYLAREFSRYYIPSQVKFNVSMGRLRTIKVFVIGNVRKPGSFTISSLSTLINALFAAGGPAKDGSMRDIRLIRDGKTLVHFDLYDFLQRGDSSKDVRLMPEDVIFVPPVGPLVGVAGSVKMPAIYEMKGDTRVMDLIKEAGGTDSIAYNYRLQLLRIKDGRKQVRVEMNLSDIEKDPDKNFLLTDGDLVTIFPVPQVLEDTVKISGAVKAPGAFGLRPGMKISDLLTYAGGTRRYADMENAELTRLNITPNGPEIKRFTVNLRKAEQGDQKSDITLKRDDYLLVRSVPEWSSYHAVSINGEVLFPGKYIVIKKGETLSSLIARAGGFTDKAYLEGAIFTRESVRKSQQRVLNDMVERLKEQSLESSTQAIRTAATPESIQAEKSAAEQQRALIEKLSSLKAKGRITIRLARLKKFRGGPYDIPLEDGDALYIPDKPSQVEVMGSVYNQTAFVYIPGMSVNGYLEKAGGATKDADESSMYILKADGTAVSRRQSGGLFDMHYDTETHSWTNGSFMSRRLDPGDAIVVPVETEKISWLRNIKDISQILFQAALSAGVVLSLH